MAHHFSVFQLVPFLVSPCGLEQTPVFLAASCTFFMWCVFHKSFARAAVCKSSLQIVSTLPMRLRGRTLSKLVSDNPLPKHCPTSKTDVMLGTTVTSVLVDCDLSPPTAHEPFQPQAQAMCRAQARKSASTSYPWAVVANNLTLMLADVLELRASRFTSSRRGYWGVFDRRAAYFEVGERTDSWGGLCYVLAVACDGIFPVGVAFTYVFPLVCYSCVFAK